jgi:hypothetical protein
LNDHTQEFKCITTWFNIHKKDHHVNNEVNWGWGLEGRYARAREEGWAPMLRMGSIGEKMPHVLHKTTRGHDFRSSVSVLTAGGVDVLVMALD